jgi:hypothetical protein
MGVGSKGLERRNGMQMNELVAILFAIPLSK